MKSLKSLKSLRVAVLGVAALLAVPAFAETPIASATYRCAGDKGIDATYYPDSVDLTLTDGRSLDLPQVISGSGTRYANADESFQFFSKGDTAFIAEGSDDNITFKDCLAIQ